MNDVVREAMTNIIGALLLGAIVLSPWIAMIVIAARGPRRFERKRPTPYIRNGPDNPLLYCGCGWRGFMDSLSESGYCPSCGCVDDLLEMNEVRAYESA